jgi:hypothetical protein
MINRLETAWISRVFPDLLAFAMGLGMAWFLKWQTADLVWSLWLCSLTLGYLTLLSGLAAGAYIGFHAIMHPDFQKEHRLKAIIGGTVLGLFLLGFFSLHFGGFHAGHSVFLRQFFPIDGMPKDGFGEAFMNPPLLWTMAFQYLMAPYGIFLLPALIAERKHVFRPMIQAVAAVQSGASPINPMQAKKEGGKKIRKGNPLGEAMGRPYINVVRMHLLIFFFAFSHFLKLDSFIIYAVVYAVYFFPWMEIKNLKAG